VEYDATKTRSINAAFLHGSQLIHFGNNFTGYIDQRTASNYWTGKWCTDAISCKL